jgi:hypothetical protein
MRRTTWTLLLSLFLAASLAGDALADPPPKPVPFPKGYRQWTHVTSMVIYGDKHPLFGAFGGIHHVYANDKALKTLKAKKPQYPDGASFAFDLLESPESGGAYGEGKRKFVAVITHDGKKYAETEGWGWQAFEGGDPTKPVVKDLTAQKACATCHKEVAAKGFVFAEWHD